MSGGLMLLTGALDDCTVSRREALRYLGIRANVTPELDAMLDRAHSLLRDVAVLKACCTRLPLTVTGDTLDFGAFRLESRALKKNLDGCRETFLFAATLGIGADRQILRLEKAEPAFAPVFDAYCSAAVEGWCNFINAQLAEEHTLRPRFSPGYGDVPLSVQRDVLLALDAQRRLGITLSDTFFMTPTKSVTAFVGIG